MDGPPARAARWVAAVLGSPIVKAVRQAGGVDALTLRCGLGDGRVVTLRLLPDPEIAAKQPLTIDLAMLTALAGSSLPVPVVFGADVTGEHAGAPALLLSWIDGAPRADLEDPVGAARQVIDVLGHVHALDPAALTGLPRLTGDRVQRQPWPGLAGEPLGAALWSELRRSVPDERRPLVPIHGDAWIGNLIWRGQTLAGLIDWSDARLSDPAADLAVVRIDVATALGPEAAVALPAGDHQRFWDLWSVALWLAEFDAWITPLLDLGSPLSAEETRTRLRGYAEFLLDS